MDRYGSYFFCIWLGITKFKLFINILNDWYEILEKQLG